MVRAAQPEDQEVGPLGVCGQVDAGVEHILALADLRVAEGCRRVVAGLQRHLIDRIHVEQDGQPVERDGGQVNAVDGLDASQRPKAGSAAGAEPGAQAAELEPVGAGPEQLLHRSRPQPGNQSLLGQGHEAADAGKRGQLIRWLLPSGAKRQCAAVCGFGGRSTARSLVEASELKEQVRVVGGKLQGLRVVVLGGGGTPSLLMHRAALNLDADVCGLQS